ncbi:ABC transporter permease, partial [Gemmatimonadota bacterium]
METLRQDIGFALRTLRNSPGFAFIAVLSLALGIGANSAIYSVYSALFNRQLGVRDVGSLVDIYTSDEFDEYMVSSYPDYVDIRDQSGDVLEGVLTYNMTLAIQDLGEESRYVFGEEVSGNYFQLLGVEPALGRLFEETDDIFGAEPTVVLMHGTWKALYGGDPDVLGQRMKLNGSDFTIIGVAPSDFTGMFPFKVDMWIPIHMREINSPEAEMSQEAASLESRGSRSLWLKGRLREGITLEQAQATLATIGERLAEDYPESNEGRHINALLTADVAMVPFLDRPVKLFLVFLMAMV